MGVVSPITYPSPGMILQVPLVQKKSHPVIVEDFLGCPKKLLMKNDGFSRHDTGGHDFRPFPGPAIFRGSPYRIHRKNPRPWTFHLTNHKRAALPCQNQRPRRRYPAGNGDPDPVVTGRLHFQTTGTCWSKLTWLAGNLPYQGEIHQLVRGGIFRCFGSKALTHRIHGTNGMFTFPETNSSPPKIGRKGRLSFGFFRR